MTLAQIKLLALRQLDEDPQDISEYDDLFKAYANMGYAIALREYMRPRVSYTIHTNAKGEAPMPMRDVVRVAAVQDETGREVAFISSRDGSALRTGKKDKQLEAICEVMRPPLEEDTDVPSLPPFVHGALADYICYRHLSSGNLAKQSRAQFFLSSFLRQMNAIRPQGMGSVTQPHGLYTVSDTRYMGREMR